MGVPRAVPAIVALVVVLVQALVVPATARPLKPVACVRIRPVVPPPLPAKLVVSEYIARMAQSAAARLAMLEPSVPGNAVAEYQGLKEAAYNLVLSLDDPGQAIYWAKAVEERAAALVAALAGPIPVPGEPDCDAVRVAALTGAAAYAELAAGAVIWELTTFHILPVVPTEPPPG